MQRSWRQWLVLAVLGAVALLVSGCPKAPPPPEEAQPRPELPIPPAPIRPMTINAATAGPPNYAHRMVEVRDRWYKLRTSGSIAEYNAEVERQMLRLSLKELDKEIARSGWSSYINTSRPDLSTLPEYPRGDYSSTTHRDWLAARGRSYYDTHYWWPNNAGVGLASGVDQDSLRAGWASQSGAAATTGGGGAGAPMGPRMGGPGMGMGPAMGPGSMPGGGGAMGGPRMMGATGTGT